MKPGLGGCYGEKVIFGQKWALRAMLAEDLQNDHFGPQNHIFSVTTYRWLYYWSRTKLKQKRNGFHPNPLPRDSNQKPEKLHPFGILI